VHQSRDPDSKQGQWETGTSEGPRLIRPRWGAGTEDLWLKLESERRRYGSGNERGTSDWRARELVSRVNQSCHVGERHAKWPRALLWLMFRGTSWVGSSVKVVTGCVEGTGSGNIILPCSLRRDPHQLGSAEETTDAHFEEKSLHPCTQDARWRLSSSHACFFPHANLAPPASIRTSLFSPRLHEGMGGEGRTAKLQPRNSKRRCASVWTDDECVLHIDRHAGGDKYESAFAPLRLGRGSTAGQ
jgi:hypothetical protein